MVNQFGGVCRQQSRRNSDAAVSSDIQIRDPGKLRFDPRSFGDDVGIVQQTVRHAGSDCSEPQYSYLVFFHQQTSPYDVLKKFIDSIP